MDYGEWELIFEEHFNGKDINRYIWNFEEGFIRNHEPQYYTDRPENARIDNGELIIVTRREEYKGASYTSASLNTQGKREFMYGLLEIRAKLPHGRGIWPAFWTLGSDFGKNDWPLCGEIDILETIGNKNGDRDASIDVTLHWKSEITGEHDLVTKKHHYSGKPLWKEYHTYAIDWSEERIVWLLDGEMIFSAVITDEMQGCFNQPHFVLLNTALSDFNDDERPDETTPLPQEYRIDYLRVYKKCK